MNFDIMLQIISRHKGKTIGITLGFLFGIFTVILGFWKTFFITLCIIAGYTVGKRFDENDRFKEFLDRIWGNR